MYRGLPIYQIWRIYIDLWRHDYKKSFHWGSNIWPGPSCFELYQYGVGCISIIRDSSCTRKQNKDMFFREWNIIRCNWIQYHFTVHNILELADSSPMLAWRWCRFPPSHGTFHYFTGMAYSNKCWQRSIMLYGIAQVKWIKYPDKIFLTAKEWGVVLQQYVT